jgi:hypothetical protein
MVRHFSARNRHALRPAAQRAAQVYRAADSLEGHDQMADAAATRIRLPDKPYAPNQGIG